MKNNPAKRTIINATPTKVKSETFVGMVKRAEAVYWERKSKIS
jgi:hypothetical protein